MREFTIKKKEENQRLDKYLKKLLPNATTSFLYKMFRKKNICYNGKKASGNELLREGDTITIFFSEETFTKFSGDLSRQEDAFEELANLGMSGITIVYEDSDILIADKPFNMLSQKASATDISANEILLGYLIRTGKITKEEFATFRPSVCNRLDRNTTGLILMGITLKGSQELSKMLKERTIQKFYLTVVSGHVTSGEHLSGYLCKDQRTNRVSITQKPVQDDSKPIETSYEPLCYANGTTLLKVHLITGKTHQIRAHLASVGHPIIGDPKYGDRELNQTFQKKYQVKGQLLHAFLLEFPGGRVYKAEPPAAFSRISAKFQDAI